MTPTALFPILPRRRHSSRDTSPAGLARNPSHGSIVSSIRRSAPVQGAGFLMIALNGATT
jgi:hypothetical protein